MRISDWSSDVCSSDLRLPPLLVFGLERPVAGRDAEVRRALEDGEVRRLLGDDRDRLDRRGAGSDPGDAPPREVHGLVRPCAGVERAAAEAVDAGNFGQLGGGQAAGRHHAVLRRYPLAAVGAHVPAAGALVEGGAGDARVEGDVAAQVETVGDMAGIAEDFRSEKHTSELQSLMSNSYAVFC